MHIILPKTCLNPDLKVITCLSKILLVGHKRITKEDPILGLRGPNTQEETLMKELPHNSQVQTRDKIMLSLKHTTHLHKPMHR